MQVWFYTMALAPQHIANITEQEFNEQGGCTMYLKQFNSVRLNHFAEYCGVFEGADGTTAVLVFDNIVHAHTWMETHPNSDLLIDNL